MPTTHAAVRTTSAKERAATVTNYVEAQTEFARLSTIAQGARDVEHSAVERTKSVIKVPSPAQVHRPLAKTISSQLKQSLCGLKLAMVEALQISALGTQTFPSASPATLYLVALEIAL